MIKYRMLLAAGTALTRGGYTFELPLFTDANGFSGNFRSSTLGWHRNRQGVKGKRKGEKAMERRTFLKSAGLVAGGLAASSSLPNWGGQAKAADNSAPTLWKETSGRPNILVIIVDQLRFPQGHFNQEIMDLAAPNLKKLREQSVSFDSHYAAATMCSPSRSTLLTGLYTHQNGMFLTNTEGLVAGAPATPDLDPGFPTWGSILNSPQFRYNTYWWGKWHLSGNDATTPDYAEQYGFTTGGLPCPSPNGAPGQGLGVDPLTNYAFKNWLTDIAASGAGPWCTTVSLVNPHDVAWYPKYTNRDPLTDSEGTPGEDNPPSIFHDLPANFESWPEALGPQERKPGLQQAFVAITDLLTGVMPTNPPDGLVVREIWTRLLDLYVQVTHYVDLQIKDVLDALESAKGPDGESLAESTIVVFLSDHGEYGGAHGLHGKGFTAYEESIHVPLYVYDPTNDFIHENQRGTTRSELTSHVDILPLLMTLASGSNAWRTKPQYAHLAGRADLAAMLSNPNAKGRDYIVHTSDEDLPEESLLAGVLPPQIIAILEKLGYPPSHVIGYRTKTAKLGVYSFFAPGTIQIMRDGQQAELYNYQTDGIGEVENRVPRANAPGDPVLLATMANALFNPTSGAVVTELRQPLPKSLQEVQRRAIDTYLKYESEVQATSSVTQASAASPDASSSLYMPFVQQ